MQADKEFQVEPGETGEAKLYFFNIHGNRVTHVRIYVRDAPSDWDVKVEPETHLKQFNVSGFTVNSTENLYVDPSSSVPEKPDSAPEGVEYIKMEGVDGYVPAKVARIIVNPPEDTSLGKKFNVRIEAIANWFGQTGTVSFSQSRSFDYDVVTVTHQYNEEVVETKDPMEDKGAIPWTYMIVGLLIIVIVLQAVLYLRKR